jgi:hypothetical protein
MSGEFKLNWNQREFERAVNDSANKAVVEQAQRLQSALDSLLGRSKGKTVAQIKPMVKEAFRQIGGSITEPELSQYAEVLADGRRIVMRPEPIT